jgi:dihydrofolate synthase/folylpolyglutamate synthase
MLESESRAKGRTGSRFQLHFILHSSLCILQFSIPMSPVDSAYHAALEFLLNRIDYEKTVNIPYRRGEFRLDRMRQLLARLGNPQNDYPIVHITGTKGKGSTSAMTAAMLTAAGFNTGLYTSPHLERIEERIRWNGVPCTADEFVELLEIIMPHVLAIDEEAKHSDTMLAGPTYFELTTAMALVHFARRKAQAVVLEVGLGGRLDSTNVVSPAVTVITNISFDHTKQLGRTLAAIAGEKGGIIKPGVPIISGVLPAEPKAVIEQIAQLHGSPLRQLGTDFDFSYIAPANVERDEKPRSQEDCTARNNALPCINFHYQSNAPIKDISLGLLGRHQASNAALALATIIELRKQGWNLSDEAIRRGLQQLKWLARIEIISRRPTVVLDAAHNEASITALIETLRESFQARKRWLIFASTKEKPTLNMLRQLFPFFDAIILTQYHHNPRALPLDQLKSTADQVAEGTQRINRAWHRSWVAEKMKLARTSTSARTPLRKPPVPPNTTSAASRIELAATPAEAWKIAKSLAAAEDLICVTGSFFLTTEIRPAITQ